MWFPVNAGVAQACGPVHLFTLGCCLPGAAMWHDYPHSCAAHVAAWHGSQLRFSCARGKPHSKVVFFPTCVTLKFFLGCTTCKGKSLPQRGAAWGQRSQQWLLLAAVPTPRSPFHSPSHPSQERDSNIALCKQKVESLEAELQDLSSQESKDEASLAKVRKQLRDLEAKAKDQEEELDEQAGTIQMLEQVGRDGSLAAPVLSFPGQALALPVFWACRFHGGVCQAFLLVTAGLLLLLQFLSGGSGRNQL